MSDLSSALRRAAFSTAQADALTACLAKHGWPKHKIKVERDGRVRLRFGNSLIGPHGFTERWFDLDGAESRWEFSLADATPRPWRHDAEGVGAGPRVLACDDRATIVADVTGACSNPQAQADAALIVAAVNAWPSYPATPVDCLISELRDLFGMNGRAYLMKDEFEARVAQFKAEVAG